jgi:uncharacterized repeat protein (TIGR03803 family)
VKTLTFCLAMFVASCSLAFGQQYKVLWSFDRSVSGDGAFPVSSLIADGAGNLYGTTEVGGANDGGVVFELSPNSDGSWSESILYDFCSVIGNGGFCLDGQYPVAGLIFDKAGNLYGTTSQGGSGTGGYRFGTVFELSPPSFQGDGWTESVLYNFCAGSNTKCQDGGEPTSQLIFDGAGNLYGTTLLGGTNPTGGTVFELSPGTGGWVHTTLYNFCVNGRGKICPDGDQPQAGVTFDRAGNLFGTTMLGGVKNSEGAGTVFQLSPLANGWSYSLVLAFSPTGQGPALPLGVVSFDPAATCTVRPHPEVLAPARFSNCKLKLAGSAISFLASKTVQALPLG